MDKKIILVLGATDRIGKVTAKALAKQEYNTYHYIRMVMLFA